MKKLTCFSLILSSLFFTSCSKQGAQGAQGPAGTAGSQGTSITTFYPLPGSIPIGVFTGVSGAYKYAKPDASLDNYTNQLLDVYFTINSNPTSPKAVYYSLPATDVFQSGDLLYNSFGHDTVYFYYTGTTPPLYQINYVIVVVPQPQ